MRYNRIIDIIFSVKPNNLSTMRPMIPKPVTINRNFLMSSRAIDFVNNKARAALIMKTTVPITSSIQLPNDTEEITAKVTVAAIADERRIFPDERQSTVTP